MAKQSTDQSVFAISIKSRLRQLLFTDVHKSIGRLCLLYANCNKISYTILCDKNNCRYMDFLCICSLFYDICCSIQQASIHPAVNHIGIHNQATLSTHRLLSSCCRSLHTRTEKPAFFAFRCKQSVKDIVF